MMLKRMIPLLALGLMVAAAALPGVAWAQPTSGPADRRGQAPRGGTVFLERLVELMDELQLSDEQKAEAKRIVDEAREELRSAMQEMQQLEPRERAQRIREQLAEVRQQLAALLSEEQRQRLRQRLEEGPPLADRPGAGRRAGGPGRGPATQPAGPEARLTAIAQRFREAIDRLELAEEQKAQAVKVADELRGKMQALRQEAQEDLERLRSKAREYLNDARLELQEILTPEQQEQLRRLMQGPPEPRPERPQRRAPPPPGDGATDPSDQPDQPPDGGPQDSPRAMARPPDHVQVGQPAADFALEKLDGRPVQLSSFKGRILVLLFGNYSSPTFRDRAADYELLRRQFANRADFLIIYTRESHAVGEWEVERNKRARIRVEQPTSSDERKALARQARQALKLTIPMAVDTMDDATARGYSGLTTCAVVIGRDGTILGYRRHADIHALKRLLEQAIGH